MTVQLEIKERDGEHYYQTYRYGKPVWKRASSVISTVPLGSRHYLDARTGTAHPSVTSILGMEPAPGLEHWKRQNVARAAHRSAHFIRELPEEAAVKYLLQQADSSDAADKGSEVHDFAERLVLGESVKESDVPERVRPHYRHFRDFLDTVQPATHSAELIAWSDTYGYAGSYDWMGTIKVNPRTRKCDPAGEPFMLVGDYKSGKRVYPKVAKQLVGYALADKIMDFDGNEQPVPEIAGGMVLHITEEGWDLRPVDLGEETQRAFLADLTYFNANAEWESATGIIGRSWAKSAAGRQTGTERRS